MNQSESDTAATHSVRFSNSKGEWHVEVEDGTTLLDAARLCDAPVQTLCHGIGACVQCKVRVIDNPENLSAPESLEKDRMGNIFQITGERMGCQAKVHGPTHVEPLPARLPKRKLNKPRKRR